MILSKIILAATMSATLLWFMPTQSNGTTPIHEHCDCSADCGHGHCGSDCTDCGHSDAEHAMPAASPDTHTDHSTVNAATMAKDKKCIACNGKGTVKQTCSQCDGKKRVPKPGSGGLLYMECPRCDKVLGFATGKETVKCFVCQGSGRVPETLNFIK